MGLDDRTHSDGAQFTVPNWDETTINLKFKMVIGFENSRDGDNGVSRWERFAVSDSGDTRTRFPQDTVIYGNVLSPSGIRTINSCCFDRVDERSIPPTGLRVLLARYSEQRTRPRGAGSICISWHH